MVRRIRFFVCRCKDFNHPHGYIYVEGREVPTPAAFSVEYCLRYLKLLISQGYLRNSSEGDAVYQAVVSAFLPASGTEDDVRNFVLLDQVGQDESENDSEIDVSAFYCEAVFETIKTLFAKEDADHPLLSLRPLRPLPS